MIDWKKEMDDERMEEFDTFYFRVIFVGRNERSLNNLNLLWREKCVVK